MGNEGQFSEGNGPKRLRTLEVKESQLVTDLFPKISKYDMIDPGCNTGTCIYKIIHMHVRYVSYRGNFPERCN